MTDKHKFYQVVLPFQKAGDKALRTIYSDVRRRILNGPAGLGRSSSIAGLRVLPGYERGYNPAIYLGPFVNGTVFLMKLRQHCVKREEL